MPGLGRKFAPDERDHNHLLRAVVPAKTTRTYRYWNDQGWWGNQGDFPFCVGYSGAGWIEDGPVTRLGIPPILDPVFLYQEAQKVDEWEGEGYDGTSVRAAAKVMQSLGYISEYRWAFDINELITTVLEVGPVVVGTNWYDSMFKVDAAWFIRIQPTARIAGGHAYIINGVNVKREEFRVKNSWGRDWGEAGRAKISFDDMARLIAEDGEIMLGIEK